MKIKMWSLINKKTGKIIKIDVFSAEEKLYEAIGFASKEALKRAAIDIDSSEEMKKIEVEDA